MGLLQDFVWLFGVNDFHNSVTLVASPDPTALRQLICSFSPFRLWTQTVLNATITCCAPKVVWNSCWQSGTQCPFRVLSYSLSPFFWWRLSWCAAGSTLEAMAHGIEQSAVVLVCCSHDYEISRNCRKGDNVIISFKLVQPWLEYCCQCYSN